MDFTSIYRCFLLWLMTYIATLTSSSLLTGTIGIINNRNILRYESDERKYLEKKYNEL